MAQTQYLQCCLFALLNKCERKTESVSYLRSAAQETWWGISRARERREMEREGEEIDFEREGLVGGAVKSLI